MDFDNKSSIYIVHAPIYRFMYVCTCTYTSANDPRGMRKEHSCTCLYTGVTVQW